MTLYTLLKKDLNIELREKSFLVSILSLFLMVSIIVSLGFYVAIVPAALIIKVISIIFWLSFILIQTATINRSFSYEFELGALYSIAARSKSLEKFFYAKFISNTIIGIIGAAFFALCLLILLPIDISTILSSNITTYTPTLTAVILGISAYSALATLLSPISILSSLKEVLLVLLLIPMSFPIFFSVLEVSASFLSQNPISWDSPWITLLAIINILYIWLGGVLFDHTIKG